MRDTDHNTPAGQYNVFPIYVEDEINNDEIFTVEVTDCGVYLDHNYINGCLYISHDDFEDLNEFRAEFIEEINES